MILNNNDNHENNCQSQEKDREKNRTHTTRERQKQRSAAWRRSKFHWLPSEGRKGLSTWSYQLGHCSLGVALSCRASAIIYRKTRVYGDYQWIIAIKASTRPLTLQPIATPKPDTIMLHSSSSSGWLWTSRCFPDWQASYNRTLGRLSYFSRAR